MNKRGRVQSWKWWRDHHNIPQSRSIACSWSVSQCTRWKPQPMGIAMGGFRLSVESESCFGDPTLKAVIISYLLFLCESVTHWRKTKCMFEGPSQKLRVPSLNLFQHVFNFRDSFNDVSIMQIRRNRTWTWRKHWHASCSKLKSETWICDEQAGRLPNGINALSNSVMVLLWFGNKKWWSDSNDRPTGSSTLQRKNTFCQGSGLCKLADVLGIFLILVIAHWIALISGNFHETIDTLFWTCSSSLSASNRIISAANI